MTALPVIGSDAQLKEARILIIDDNQFNREILEIFYTNHGWRHLAHSADGAEGLALVEEFNPDIILLDLSMPIMDGFTFCEKLRALPKHGRVPVIVQTALSGLEERQRAFTSGATDFISKPVFQEELIARTKLHLQNRMLVQRLEGFYDRVSSELDAARTMQMQIMPGEAAQGVLLAGLPLALAAHFAPATELGGDIWGARRLGDNQLMIYCADFSGHGVAAAINTFRLHILVNGLAPNICADPGTMLQHLNAELCEALPRGQFLAMFAAVIDTARETLSYTSAAMPDPLLVNGGSAQRLKGSGLPLGITQKLKYQTITERFAPGDQLVMFSDALVESRGPAGLSLDHSRLMEEVTSNVALTSHGTLAHILDLFDSYAGQHSDDLTVLCLQFT